MAKQSSAQLVSQRLHKITHAAEIKIWQDAYNAAHSAEKCARLKAIYDADPEAARAKALAWYYKNREKVKARKRVARLRKLAEDPDFDKKEYAKYAEKARARTKAYKLAHPEKGLSYESMRRAAKRAPGAELVSVAVLYIRDNKTCTLCHLPVTRSEWSIDHIIPLSKGGEHTYRNCALAHKLCNIRKRDGVVAQQMHLF